MTLLQLKYFITVCECGNVTQAAEKLHVSQPSISHALRELEIEYQITLFQRVHKKMHLTENGYFLWKKADEILQKCNELESELGRMGKRELHIGIPPMIGSILFPRVFLNFYAQNPDIKVSITEQGSLKIKEMVEKGELEAALIIGDAGENTELSCHRILRTKLKFCVSSKHKFGTRKSISLRELDGEAVVGLKEDSFLPRYLKTVFAEYSITPNIILEAAQLSMIKAILENGDAGAFLFQEIADRENELTGIMLDEPIGIDVCMIWRKDSMVKSEMKRFVNYVKRMPESKDYDESGDAI